MVSRLLSQARKLVWGAWDLIGILAGVPLFVWISFGLITYWKSSKFEEALANVETSKTRGNLV